MFHSLTKVSHAKRLEPVGLTESTILIVHLLLGQRHVWVLLEVTQNPRVGLGRLLVGFLGENILVLFAISAIEFSWWDE